MAAINFTSGMFQALDNDGNFVPYGQVLFTDNATGDPIETFQDSDMLVSNTHPVVLSPSGKAYIIVPEETTADIDFRDQNGVTIWYLENYDITSQTAIDNISAQVAQTAADVVESGDSVLDAESWANEDEDVAVQEFTDGDGEDVVPEAFSSKHFSLKSEEQKDLAITAKDEAETARDDTLAQLALCQAQVVLATDQADLSATSAGESEVSNEASEDRMLEAGSWANEDEDVPVQSYSGGVGTDRVPTVYSAKHWAAKAAGIVGGSIDGLTDVDTSGKADTDLFTWDAGGGNWVPVTRASMFIASLITADTTNFNNNLSAADDTVQKALDTIDNLAISATALSTSTDTTNFNNNLSASDTDVQKALDTIDNMAVPKVNTPALEAGTVIVEGVQLDLALTNYSADLTTTIVDTNLTVTNNAGTLECETPTTATPSFTVQYDDPNWTGDESAIITRNLTTTLATPTLPSPPADANVDTDVTYTFTVSDNSTDFVIDFGSTDITHVSTTGATFDEISGTTMVFNTVSGTSIAVTMQFTADDTYSVDAVSSDTVGDYVDSSASTADEIIIAAVSNDKFESLLFTGQDLTPIDCTYIVDGVDAIHLKRRDTTAIQGRFSSLRGASKLLIPSATTAETTVSGVTVLGTSSFTLGTDANFNASGASMIAWINSLPVNTPSNTNGTITSTVNASDYMSQVIYNANNNTPSTVGHGLSSAPEWIEVKNRDAATNYRVYSKSIANTESLLLDTNAAEATYDAWNSTSPTSTVFSIGAGNDVNYSTNQHIANCYITEAGQCKVDTFTVASGSISGGNINVGFDIGLLDVKRIGATGNWFRMTKGNANALTLDTNDTETTVGANPCGFGSNTISNVSLPDGDYIYKAIVAGA